MPPAPNATFPERGASGWLVLTLEVLACRDCCSRSSAGRSGSSRLGSAHATDQESGRRAGSGGSAVDDDRKVGPIGVRELRDALVAAVLPRPPGDPQIEFSLRLCVLWRAFRKELRAPDLDRALA